MSGKNKRKASVSTEVSTIPLVFGSAATPLPESEDENAHTHKYVQTDWGPGTSASLLSLFSPLIFIITGVCAFYSGFFIPVYGLLRARAFVEKGEGVPPAVFDRCYPARANCMLLRRMACGLYTVPHIYIFYFLTISLL